MKFVHVLVCAFALMSCGRRADFSVSGTLSKPSSQIKRQTAASTTKTITHVMAISPESADPKRFIAKLEKDQFKLDVESGKPYVLVFVAADQGLKGPDMIAGIFKVPSNDLDTLAPAEAGKAELGNVDVDQKDKKATMSTTVEALLKSLGLSADEAAFLGKIDNLSLRSANPDIDGNGVIDELESKSF